MSLTSAVRVSGGVARRLGAIGSRASAFIPSQCPLMTSATRESSSDDVFRTNDRQRYNAAEALCSWNRNTCFRRKLIYVLAFNYDMHMLCLKNSDGNGLRTQNDSIQTFIHIWFYSFGARVPCIDLRGSCADLTGPLSVCQRPFSVWHGPVLVWEGYSSEWEGHSPAWKNPVATMRWPYIGLSQGVLCRPITWFRGHVSRLVSSNSPFISPCSVWIQSWLRT